VVPAPYLLLEPEVDNVTLIFNKFGDPTVEHYRIYAGLSPGPTNVVATSRSTLYHFRNAVNGVSNYFRVAAVSTNGNESDWSNEESLVVSIIKPGQNLVSNGDFSEGPSGWSLAAGGSASARLVVSDGVARVSIDNGGGSPAEVQLRQIGLSLIQGREFVLEFDAWADGPRVVEVNAVQSEAPRLNYSRIAPVMVTPVRTHFRYVFTMDSPSDPAAELVFNAGASAVDLHLDNVSLMMSVVVAGDFNRDGRVDYQDLALFSKDWLKAQGDLAPDLNTDGKVDFDDLAILGDNWSGDQ
jgi:hypothetical protein